MEIPYQFDWVIGVTLRKQNHGATIKDLAYESFTDFSEKIAKGFGYELELSPTWYEEYQGDELTILFKLYLSFRAQRSPMKNSSTTSGCNTSAISLITRKK